MSCDMNRCYRQWRLDKTPACKHTIDYPYSAWGLRPMILIWRINWIQLGEAKWLILCFVFNPVQLRGFLDKNQNINLIILYENQCDDVNVISFAAFRVWCKIKIISIQLLVSSTCCQLLTRGIALLNSPVGKTEDCQYDAIWANCIG